MTEEPEKECLMVGVLRRQYGAALEMVRLAVDACPDELWDERKEEPPFWQQAYHTAVSCAFYLSGSPEAFDRERPSFYIEAAPRAARLGGGQLDETPQEALSKDQVAGYVETVKEKCGHVLDDLTPQSLKEKNAFPWSGPTVADTLVYCLRHAQHHIGRLHSILARKTDKKLEWICQHE